MKKFLVSLIAGLAVTVPLFAVATQPSVPPAGYEDTVLTNIGTYQNPFPDTDMSQLGGKAAAELYRRAVIGGFPDGQFKGEQPVNRAEAAKFLLLARFGTVDDVSNSNRFPDVLDNQWYTKFVVTAASKGIISGYPDGTFKPADQVNTAEFLKMLSLTFGLQLNMSYSYNDVSANDWFAPYTGIAQKYVLFPSRSTTLHPETPLSREDVAVAIYQYLLNRNSDGSQQPPISGSTPSITVLSPNGGETWVEGTTQVIRWTSTGVKHVGIDARCGGHDMGYITMNTPSTGEYSWTIPDGYATGFTSAGCKNMYLRVEDVDNMATVFDDNNAAFYVGADSGSPQPSSSIQLLSPNGGETLTIGSPYTFTYSLQNITVNAQNPLLVYLVRYGNAAPNQNMPSQTVLVGKATDAKSATFTLDPLLATWPGVGSNYKVEICADNACRASDASNQFVTLSNGGTACTTSWTKIHTPSGSGNVPDENATVQFQGKIWTFDADGLGNLYAYSSIDGSNWTQESTLPAGANAHSAFLWGNKMYVGVDVYSPQRGSWLYATSDGHSWEQVSSLPSEKGDLAVFDGRIWLIGGRTLTKDADGNDMLTAVSDVYSSQDAGKTWQKGNALPVAKTGHATLQYGNKLYVFGGGVLDSSNNAVPSTDVYSLNGRFEWQKETSLPAPVAYGYAVYSGKGIVLFANDRVYRSSDEGATWGEVTQAKLPTKLFGNSINNATATIYNNGVYVIGSFNFGEMYKYSCGDPL